MYTDWSAAPAHYWTSYFMIGRQKWPFGYKSTVQCTDDLNHKIALKFSKK